MWSQNTRTISTLHPSISSLFTLKSTVYLGAKLIGTPLEVNETNFVQKHLYGPQLNGPQAQKSSGLLMGLESGLVLLLP